MDYVKAEYLEALNKNTNNVEKVKFIPPSPEGDDLGGVSKKYIEDTQRTIAELADKKITKFYASSQGNTHLPDSDKGKIQDMFLYGKSEQAQYKGYNKLTLRDKQQINTGIECKFIDSKLQFKGTATSTYCTFDAKEVVISAGTKVTAYTDSKKDWFIWLRDSDNRLYTLNQNTKTATYDKNVTIKQFGLQNYQPGDSINEVVDFGLMVSSESYEPYVGGIPSPNPDYPQEIKAVVNPKVVVRGKNLLNATLGTETKNGVTCTVNGDGTYTVNGTATENTYFYLSKKNKLNKSFRVIGCPSGGSIRTYYFQFFIQEDNVWKIDTGNGVNVTVNEVKNLDSIAIAVKKDYTANNLVFKPMLTHDMDATYDDFVSYQQEQTVTLPYTLYAIPVSTGGNVTIGNQQYVADYVDVERGVLVRNVKRVETLKINKLPTTTAGTHGEKYYVIGVKVANGFVGVKTKGYEYIMCNNTMRVKQTDELSMNNNVITAFGFTDAFEVRIRPLVDDFPTIEKLNAYLSEMVVLYCLATSENFVLTQDQIEAYKSLSTNYPVTNIEVSSEQLDGYTIFNYPISMAEGWNYVKQQIGDTRDYVYDMDLQSAEAYVNSEYAVALTELEV